MKAVRVVAMMLVAFAVLMASYGGLKDMGTGLEKAPSKEHAWSDAHLLVLIAIFLMHL